MADENTTPVAGSVPPQAAPAAMRPATLKLKPILRKPVPGGAAALKSAPHLPVKKPVVAAAGAAEKPTEAVNALEQLKGVTQKLKGITQELPQQAILHKTGIIASPEVSEAQKQAAKARTARISLSDAIGVAPVQNEAVPMKTIRIKRPIDLPAPSKPAVAPAAEKPADIPSPSVANEVSVTQRKTLKISRPNLKVGAQKTVISKRSAVADGAAPAAAPEAAAAEVAELPAATPFAAVPAGDTVPDVSKGVAITGIILQIAACVVMGALGYYLYNDMRLPLSCGGCM